jgi:hypothetical protein
MLSVVLKFADFSKKSLFKGFKHTVRIGKQAIIRALSIYYGFDYIKFINVLELAFHKNKREAITNYKEILSSTEWIPKGEIESLVAALEPVESLELLKEKLAYLKTNVEANKILSNVFDDMESTLVQLKYYYNGSDISLLYDPCLLYRPFFFYSGMNFAVQVEMPSTQQTEIILNGGQYVPKSESDKTQTESITSAYGFNIIVSDILHFHRTNIQPRYIPRVLIYRGNYSQVGKLMQMLLDKSLPFCVYFGENKSLEGIMKYCDLHCITHLLWVISEDKLILYKDGEKNEMTYAESVEVIDSDNI